MSQTPQQQQSSKSYRDAWRAVNILIRSDGSWSGRERNVCFRNNGNGAFTDVSFVSGLDLPTDGRSFVPLDLDRDGDLDLILKNRNGRQLRAFRNDAPRGELLRVELRGTKSNRDGVGARVVLQTDRGDLVREVRAGSGYLSQRSRSVEFGVADGAQVQAVSIRWPSGTRQRIEGVPGQGTIQVVEGRRGWSPRGPDSTALDLVPGETAELLTSEGTWLAESIPAPAIDLPTLDGRWNSAEHAGSKLLINVWATWCPPCRQELADLRENADALAKAGLQVAAISVDDPDDRETVRGFAAEQSLPFPVLLADDATVQILSVLNERLFDRRRELAVPTSFLVNERGELIKIYRGETSAEVVLRDASAGAGPALPFSGRWIQGAPHRDLGELAAAFAERRLIEPARQFFQAALQQEKASASLLNNYAGLLVEIGDFEGAARELRRSIELEPGQLDAKVNLARVLAELGAVEQATDLVEEVLGRQPDDVQALALLGAIRFSEERMLEAEALYDRALGLDPQDSALYESKGALLASSGRFAQAVEAYERARELGSNHVELHSNLGVLYMRRDMPANALLAFQRAVRSAPEDYGAALNFALYYRQVRDLRNARRWAEAARALDPERAEAVELLKQLP